jgi:hypothetical protein
MAIWGCSSPACCCQPAVAGGFIYADLRSELNTHLAPQVMFTWSSPGCDCHCYNLSPFQAHWGRWHSTSQSCGFIYSSCGKWVFLLSFGVFLSPPLLQAFPLLIAGRVPLLLPSPAGLLWGISLSLLFSAQGALPSLLRVFFYCYCLLFRFFFFFPWVGVGLSRGLCWSGPGLSVGYCVLLSSPCWLLPKPSGHWCLVVARGPSWFLHLTWSGDAMHRLEVWRSQSFASSRWFFL